MIFGRLFAMGLGCVVAVSAATVIAAELVIDWSKFAQEVRSSLQRQGAIDPRRRLVHLSLVCDVVLTDAPLFHAVETRELVVGGPSPRGFNQLLILDRRWRIMDRLEIAASRPLYCDGAYIVLNQAVDSPIGGVEGNRLQINRDGHISAMDRLEPSEMRGIQH